MTKSELIEKIAAKNPRTGEKVNVEERCIAHFKTGKELHEQLNSKA